MAIQRTQNHVNNLLIAGHKYNRREMMSDLRQKLIRLAHEKPELRSHLLPLLKKASRDVYWCNPKWGCGEEYTEREADRLFAKGERTGRPTECPECGAKATIEQK